MGRYLVSLPYVLVFFLLFIISIPVKNGKNFSGKYLAAYSNIVLLYVLVFFVVTRSFVYNDYLNYYPYYNDTPTLFSKKDLLLNFFIKGQYRSWEKGFLVYTVLIKTLSPNYFVFQGISSIIDIVILYYFFKTNTKNIILCFVFWFLFEGFHSEVDNLRNAKAMMLFLLSLKYIDSKKFLKYELFNILGCFFHISSVIYLPLYFILNKKFPKTLLIILFVIGNALFFLQIKWLTSILLIFANIANFRLTHLIIGYTASMPNAFGLSIGYIERSFSFVLITLMSDKLIQNDKKNLIYINLAYLYFYTYLYCTEMALIVQRVSLLFLASYWVLYPKIYTLLKREKKYIYLTILFLYGGLKVVQGNADFKLVYENALLPHMTYQQKQSLVMKNLTKDQILTFKRHSDQ